MSAWVDLAAALAEAVRTIDATLSLEETLLAITTAAGASVLGFDHIGITTVDKRGRVQTRAATDDVVQELDDLQYSTGQGQSQG